MFKVIKRYEFNGEKYIPAYETVGLGQWLKRQFHNPFKGFENLFVKRQK